MGRGGKRVNMPITNLSSRSNNSQGGRGGGRGGRGRGGGGRRGGEDNRVSFEKVPKQNEKLEKYYNSVLRLSNEEKDEFWDALKRELPNSFRFAGSKGYVFSKLALYCKLTRYLAMLLQYRSS